MLLHVLMIHRWHCHGPIGLAKPKLGSWIPRFLQRYISRVNVSGSASGELLRVYLGEPLRRNNCEGRRYAVVEGVISQCFITLFLFYWFGTNIVMQDTHPSYCFFSPLTPRLCPVDGSKVTQSRRSKKKKKKSARCKFFHTMSGTLEAPSAARQVL